MGAANALLVVNRWSPYLRDTEFRALVQMALISLDADERPRYWGGWAPIARAIGAPFPDACERGEHPDPYPKPRPSECRSCQAAQRAVSRAVTPLVDRVCVVERLRRASKGTNAEYGLLIRAMPAVERLDRRTPQRTSHVRRSTDVGRPTYDGRATSATTDVLRPSEEERGGEPGIDTGMKSPWPGTSPATSANEPTPKNLPSPPTIPAPRPPTDHELAECPICRWMAWEGHAAGCRNT